MPAKTRVLLLDDEAAIRKVLGDGLRRLGYEVIEAGDADTARKLLKHEPCAVAVLDVVLPVGASGMYLAAWLRIEYPDLPLILISGYADVDMVTQALRIGVCDFLHKPIKVEELGRAVKRALSGEISPSLRKLAGSKPAAGEIKDSEKRRIKAALEQTDGNRTQAAEMLGISRSTLWSRMKSLGIRFRPTESMTKRTR